MYATHQVDSLLFCDFETFYDRLATLVSNQSRDPLKKSTLIVAPLALLDQWQMEVEMKTNCDLKCLIYHGTSLGNFSYIVHSLNIYL